MTAADRRRAPLGVERVRDEHPPAGEWRADALAGSRHSRLLDELRMPRGELDPERAARLCAELCRAALRDLAPALILLPAGARRRAQTLAAHALTLFDFARQSGLEGERLAQINRWLFSLEEALDGDAEAEPPDRRDGEPAGEPSGEPSGQPSRQPAGQRSGQPIFQQMAAEDARRAWPRDGLDRLAAAARHRVANRRPPTAAARAGEANALAGALCECALGGRQVGEADGRLVELVAALLRLFALIDLGEGLRRHDARLPLDELAEGWEPGGDRSPAALGAAVELECRRIEPLLANGRRAPAALPAEWRRAVRFAALAGARLLELVRAAGPAVATAPPRLGVGARLGLLIRARLGGSTLRARR